MLALDQVYVAYVATRGRRFAARFRRSGDRRAQQCTREQQFACTILVQDIFRVARMSAEEGNGQMSLLHHCCVHVCEVEE
jgi:hypothetical protein